MLNFSDKVSTSAVRKTADGYLVADAAVARTGIQNYLGREVGKPDMPIVRVYRPAEQVFSKDAMKTYAHRPMTNDHPSVAVNAENWKDYAVGQTGGDVMRDGEFVRVPLVLMDQKAINDWDNGKVELSMGYSADIVFQKGVTDSGEEYDAIQTNLQMNHLALVDKARGGDKLRIGDKGNPDIIHPAQMTKDEGGHMADLRKVLVDGLPVETTEAGETAINLLKTKVADAEKAGATLVSDHAKAIAAKDAEIAKKDAEIDALKGKVMDAAALDAAVTARADLIAKAKTVADQDYTGKSEAEIRKMAVAKRFGDAAVADKSAEYIEARFDIAVGDSAAVDPVRSAYKGAPSNVVNLSDAAAIEQKALDAYLTRHDRKKEA
ncbi:MAG: hypothetical protein [Caudoviricetes sp.]|nr:MAG: hypothetical protein [Caudoviricetes sp.]